MSCGSHHAYGCWNPKDLRQSPPILPTPAAAAAWCQAKGYRTGTIDFWRGPNRPELVGKQFVRCIR
jgi:hypothetical protein